MPKVIQTKIRVDNTNYITYVWKKYNNQTYKLFTYQQNQSSGCYALAGVQTGKCG